MRDRRMHIQKFVSSKKTLLNLLVTTECPQRKDYRDASPTLRLLKGTEELKIEAVLLLVDILPREVSCSIQGVDGLFFKNI